MITARSIFDDQKWFLKELRVFHNAFSFELNYFFLSLMYFIKLNNI